MKTSKIVSNYQEIINKVVSSKTHKQYKLFLADCSIYNLMFITNCSEKMLLSLKLSDIWEYIDTSDSLMHGTYVIRLSELENIWISKQAYKTINAICKIINERHSTVAMLNNYSSTNFYAGFSRHHTHYLSILKKI